MLRNLSPSSNEDVDVKYSLFHNSIHAHTQEVMIAVITGAPEVVTNELLDALSRADRLDSLSMQQQWYQP